MGGSFPGKLIEAPLPHSVAEILCISNKNRRTQDGGVFFLFFFSHSNIRKDFKTKIQNERIKSLRFIARGETGFIWPDIPRQESWNKEVWKGNVREKWLMGTTVRGLPPGGEGGHYRLWAGRPGGQKEEEGSQ